MMRGAIALLLLVLVPWFVPPVAAEYPCAPDLVAAQSNADTIFVLHANAERNCCSQLTLTVSTREFTVDLFEGEAEPYCHCMCCFDLRYEAHGFAAGRYRVRVWNESGSELYGETTVDVAGPGGALALGAATRGDCIQVATQPATWSGVRTVYR